MFHVKHQKFAADGFTWNMDGVEDSGMFHVKHPAARYYSVFHVKHV